jgi:membrane protease YdiL (CAAX protease family)
VRRETLERCGLTWRDGSGTPLVVGFVVGATGLTLLLAATLASGHASLVPRDFTSMKWVTVTAGAVLTGVLVGPIEEFVFRGLLFTWVRDRVFRGRVPSALLATSVAYALLHFIDVRRPAIGTDPGVIDSLRLMAAPFRAFGDVGTLWPAGVGLFLFGLVLNALVVRTGALHASMGLHAGCVAVLRLVPYLMTFASDGVRWWGTKKVYDGVAGWVAILLIGVILAMLLRPRSHEPRSQVRR